MVATTLDTNNAFKFVTGIDATTGISTTPIRPAYIMLASTELQSDLDGLVGSGFVSAWNYASTQPAMPTEYGSVLNVRILTSSEAPVARATSANGQDIYWNPVLGKQALTHISQDGYSMKLLYRGPEFSGMLQQNCTLAVKFAQAQAITQDTGIRQLKCTRISTLGV